MSSINCEVDLKNVSEESKKHSVQFVPAKIDYSGPEKIGPFFTDFIQENADGSYNTALRGRPLTGLPLFYSFLLNVSRVSRPKTTLGSPRVLTFIISDKSFLIQLWDLVESSERRLFLCWKHNIIDVILDVKLSGPPN